MANPLISRLRARLSASDPGWIALQRGARCTLSFALTALLLWAVSSVTGQNVMAMALAFPVSIFGSVASRETAPCARLLSTLCLAAAGAACFCLSALVTSPWLNHALFLVLVFCVVYARRWGDRANAAGFGGFVSFFFGAFLAPPPAALPWHLLGLGLAVITSLVVQFVLLPQRPAASLDSARASIARRLALLLSPLERYCAQQRWRERDRSCLRHQLYQLQRAIETAKAQLDALVEGWRARIALSFSLFEVETIAERLVRIALRSFDGACTPEARRRLQALRIELSGGASAPLAAEASSSTSELAQALRALEQAHAHLRQLPADALNPAYRESMAQAPQGPTREPPGLSAQARLALQATAACALAIIGGELLSPQRWYWAVITVFAMFTGTASRGDALYKSVQRMLGTFLGVFAGMGLIALVGEHEMALFLLLLVSIYFTYYFFTDSFGTMTFFLTVMLALLFALLGRYSEHLLWLRLEETGVGALAGILAAGGLLSRATHSVVKEQLVNLLDALSGFVDASLERLLEGSQRPLAEESRSFDRSYAQFRASLQPLRLDRFGAGGRLHARIGDHLQDCRYWVHELSLIGRAGGRDAKDTNKCALQREREEFHALLGRLRERALARDSRGLVGEPNVGDSGQAQSAASADERVVAATHGLRQLGVALVQLVAASGPCAPRARLLRF
jgi:uncharacterized membrane protein YccC